MTIFTISKSVFAQPFHVDGQSPRLAANLSDPTYFPPPRNIPLHTSARVYSASDVVSDLPLSPAARSAVVRALEFNPASEHAYNAVKTALASESPYLRSEVLNRVRSFFRTTKALQDEGGRGIGGTDFFSTLESDVRKLHQRQMVKQRAVREAQMKQRALDREIALGTLEPVRGYRSEQDTRLAQIKKWKESASQKDVTAALKAARAHLKAHGTPIPNDDNDTLALASGAGAELNPVLDGQLKSALTTQQEMNVMIADAVRENRGAVLARLRQDRQREIDRAFEQLPIELFEDGGDHQGADIADPEVRENILREEGFEPATPMAQDDASNQTLLDMATRFGLYDGKAARKVRADNANHADEWLDTQSERYAQINVSGHKVGATKPKSASAPAADEPNAPNAPDASDGSDGTSRTSSPGVIAVGKRGGKIVGYRNGRPVYQRGGGAAPAPASAPASTPSAQSEPDYYQPVPRSVPVSTMSIDESPLAKSLQLASAFAQQVLMKPVEHGRLVKSKTELLESELDDCYERIVNIRAHMRPHHTAMHNEAIQKLREAHANPQPSRVSAALRFAEHFMDVVAKEHQIASEHLEECMAKPKVKKSFVLTIDSKGLVPMARQIEAQCERTYALAMDKVHEHNSCCADFQKIDVDAANAFIRKSVMGANRRAEQLVAAAESRFNLALSDADLLDELLKGVRSNADAEDLDVDDDDFETDQQQDEDLVNETETADPTGKLDYEDPFADDDDEGEEEDDE